MSELSDSIGKLAKSLEITSKDYMKEYSSRLGSLNEFYDVTLKNLIKTYDFDKDRILDLAKSFFGKTSLDYLAIDGTSFRERGNGFAIFFSASLGVRGNLDLETERVIQEGSSFKDHISMVAYIPIPYGRDTRWLFKG